MRNVLTPIFVGTSVVCIAILISITFGFIISYLDKPCVCPETLPTSVTDMFTIKGDTLVIKQGVDFVISTHAVNVDTAGIMHRKTLHSSK